MSNEKIPGAGSHHVAISSADFDRAIKFYVEGLGMRPIAFWGENEERAALLDIGDGSHIEIFSNGTTDASKNERFVHFAINTTDPDIAFENALSAGAKEKMAPFNTDILADPPIPVRIAFVYGPDNEVLEFFKML